MPLNDPTSKLPERPFFLSVLPWRSFGFFAFVNLVFRTRDDFYETEELLRLLSIANRLMRNMIIQEDYSR